MGRHLSITNFLLGPILHPGVGIRVGGVSREQGRFFPGLFSTLPTGDRLADGDSYTLSYFLVEIILWWAASRRLTPLASSLSSWGYCQCGCPTIK